MFAQRDCVHDRMLPRASAPVLLSVALLLLRVDAVCGGEDAVRHVRGDEGRGRVRHDGERRVARRLSVAGGNLLRQLLQSATTAATAAAAAWATEGDHPSATRRRCRRVMLSSCSRGRLLCFLDALGAVAGGSQTSVARTGTERQGLASRMISPVAVDGCGPTAARGRRCCPHRRLCIGRTTRRSASLQRGGGLRDRGGRGGGGCCC